VIAIIDTEATGLPSDKDARVLEIGAVVLHPHRDYAEVNSFRAVIYPGPAALDGYPRNASQVVPLEAVLGAESAATVRRAFYEWMARHQVTEVFSYNRAYDETMLKRSGFELPWAGCVMRLARAGMPGLKKDPSLTAAAAHFGVVTGTDAHHRALPDARLAAEVFAAIRRRG
jgi:DNA polymerase III epsilon subunit-like protein